MVREKFTDDGERISRVFLLRTPVLPAYSYFKVEYKLQYEHLRAAKSNHELHRLHQIMAEYGVLLCGVKEVSPIWIIQLDDSSSMNQWAHLATTIGTPDVIENN
jgi:hypothetical protein